MKSLLKITFFLFFVNTFSQTEEINQEKIIHKVEGFILSKNIDSAKVYHHQLNKNDYVNILEKIIKEKEVTYSDYKIFTIKVSERPSNKYNLISTFIDKHVKEPLKAKKINLDYVDIKWHQISNLVGDALTLEESRIKQNKLELYISRFNVKNIAVLRAKTKITTHCIVMRQIQENVEEGKSLCLKGIDVAKKINDLELQSIFLYHLSDFLILERKLQEYIDVSEESLALSNKLNEKSSYHYNNIIHLIDAYIFKGGYEKRVKNLLKELYENENTKIFSYHLFAKFISKLKKDSPSKKEILNKFKVKNTLELVTKFKLLGKDLIPNEYFRLLDESANALHAQGYFKEAMSYKTEGVFLTRSIYSKDLSETLSNYKTAQALKVKEKEIAFQNEKITLYGLISLLSIVFLLISLLVLRKIRKQSKELTEKNILINKSLKEKELLVGEMHHRVKNNFQIVSSLLELQSKNIEDEKALELAEEGKNRVKSMALIHQKLYQNKSGLVDFDEYIKLLVKELSSLYKSDNKIKTEIISNNMEFDVDTAIPLGLIINEIITNSYKYAFHENKESLLSISINKQDNDNFKLVIQDNGPGISSDFDIKKAKSLGLRLINRLVKQLHGTLSLSNENGARFEILFKDLHARQLID